MLCPKTARFVLDWNDAVAGERNEACRRRVSDSHGQFQRGKHPWCLVFTADKGSLILPFGSSPCARHTDRHTELVPVAAFNCPPDTDRPAAVNHTCVGLVTGGRPETTRCVIDCTPRSPGRNSTPDHVPRRRLAATTLSGDGDGAVQTVTALGSQQLYWPACIGLVAKKRERKF